MAMQMLYRYQQRTNMWNVSALLLLLETLGAYLHYKKEDYADPKTPLDSDGSTFCVEFISNWSP
jgi:hypothetical protein